MKFILVIIISIILSLPVSAQTIPELSDSDIIQKTDIKKKPGWLKVKLKEDFTEAASDSAAAHEFYVFYSKRGGTHIWYSKHISFPKNSSKIVYTKAEPAASSRLLNGIIDFYDKKGHRAEKYVFKDGFCVKLYGFNWWGKFKKKYNGKLYGVTEYANSKKSVESWGNFFNTKGEYWADSREVNDGYKYNYLPIRYSLIPQTELNIAQSWREGEYYSYKYSMYVDSIAHEGKRAATIKSIDASIEGPGLLVQQCKADSFLGKRIRMSGYMKTENVQNRAGFRLQVLGIDSKNALASDVMDGRWVKGTTEWTKYEIVLDVPTDALILKFGGQLFGSGQIWFDDLKFEIVDNAVKTTGREYVNGAHSGAVPPAPSNLSFEK